MKKKTLLIDLDGVLNDYDGHYNHDFIPPLRGGAREFVSSIAKNYDIKLFTCRNKLLAAKWLRENGLEVLEEVCSLSARMVVNQVSMKTENERITRIIKAFQGRAEERSRL